MKNKLTFSDLIDKIAGETGASKQIIHDLLKEIGNLTKEGLEHNGRQRIKGLGYFSLKWTKSRKGRNPQTGEVIEIPAHNKINFKPELSLRRFINRRYEDLKSKIVKDEITEDVTPIDKEPTPIKATKPESPIVDVKHEVAKPRKISQKRKKQFERKKLLTKVSGWFWALATTIILVCVILLWQPWKSVESVVEEINVAEQEMIEVESRAKEEKSQLAEDKYVDAGFPGDQHEVILRDNLWDLSNHYYNKSCLWPIIFKANRVTIKHPDTLISSIIIQIPPLEGKPGSLTEKDIKEIAEGYLHVYLVYKQTGMDNFQYYLWVAEHCNVPELADQFGNLIDTSDLEFIADIQGFSEIK
jgi:DNA-binding protein HU-beta